jgi:parallel beta-helix repeat protein
LTLTDASVLDCANHTIRGPGGDNSLFGIDVVAAQRAVVRNCRVTGFRRGVRVDRGSGNRVENVEAFENGDLVGHRQGGYGIDVGSATDTVITGCNARDNADEGIHIGGDSDHTTIQSTRATGNFREQLYLLDNRGTTLTDIQLQGAGDTGAAGLFLKNMRDAAVSDLTIRNAHLALRGASTGNRITDVHIVGGGIRFEAEGADVPSGNTVERGQVSDAAECLDSQSSGPNTIVDTSFAACTVDVVATGTAGEPSAATLIASALPGGPIELDRNSTLAIGWHLTVEVEDTSGQPVAGAGLTVTDRNGEVAGDGETGEDGRALIDTVARRLQSNGETNLTPHRIVATRPGLGSASTSVTIDGNRTITLVLR